MTKAKLHKLINDNPVEFVTKPIYKKQKGSALTKNEEKNFLESIINSKYEN